MLLLLLFGCDAIARRLDDTDEATRGIELHGKLVEACGEVRFGLNFRSGFGCGFGCSFGCGWKARVTLEHFGRPDHQGSSEERSRAWTRGRRSIGVIGVAGVGDHTVLCLIKTVRWASEVWGTPYLFRRLSFLYKALVERNSDTTGAMRTPMRPLEFVYCIKADVRPASFASDAVRFNIYGVRILF